MVNQNQSSDKLQSLVYYLSGLLFALVLLEKSITNHPPKAKLIPKDIPFLQEKDLKEIPQKAKEKLGLKNIGKEEIPILDDPTQHSISTLEQEAIQDLEEFLSEEEEVPTIGSPTKTSSSQIVQIHFIKFFGKDHKMSSRLVQVPRMVPVGKDPVLFILEELRKGPRPEEREKGVLSALPENFTYSHDYKIQNGILYLDLGSSFEFGGGPQVLKDRLDQLTYSLIGVAGIRAVQITIQKKKVSYLGGDGVPVPDLLTKSDRRVTTL